MRSRAIRFLAVPALALGVLTALAAPASATSASSSLRLAGGDTLQANAWHCGSYFNSCSFANSAKLLGSSPYNASSITNQTEVQVHGISVSISLGTSKNFGIIYNSSTLIKSRWTNYNNWISDTSGVVNVSPFSTYVSSKEIASAYHPTFGSPSGVTATAGAI